jgi:hypothetical protein
MFEQMAKFLYVRNKDLMDMDQNRALSAIPGQSSRSLSELSHNLHYRTVSMDSMVSGGNFGTNQDKQAKEGCC